MVFAMASSSLVFEKHLPVNHCGFQAIPFGYLRTALWKSLSGDYSKEPLLNEEVT